MCGPDLSRLSFWTAGLDWRGESIIGYVRYGIDEGCEGGRAHEYLIIDSRVLLVYQTEQSSLCTETRGQVSPLTGTPSITAPLTLTLALMQELSKVQLSQATVSQAVTCHSLATGRMESSGS